MSEIICGVDEVGRGPLAGDTYAAAVVLPPCFDLPGLNDSKKLSNKKREALFPLIISQATAYGIASASVQEIEALGINEAIFTAMRRAVAAMGIIPERILVDGNAAPDFGDLHTEAIVGGDGIEPCIMAASVLAKVTRDRYMDKMDQIYPGYFFAKNKGYGTKEHREQIKSIGLCSIHRLSYCKKTLEA
ncbi:MAG: ribonuclease HII [Oscillospiraceae bacterium]|nr:ribonuclease HII [Oscillospiraceae bacterium]